MNRPLYHFLKVYVILSVSRMAENDYESLTIMLITNIVLCLGKKGRRFLTANVYDRSKSLEAIHMHNYLIR